ncbi:hypothetical protein B5M50_04365 [candidate division KSB1 bacterium 4484_219]|nr:MAG: hypothetical protein B5M50_04365 [candidate division KSB1 bacterium 4484_219]
MNNQQKIRVCLIVEGAYPYVFGGVSIWTFSTGFPSGSALENDLISHAFCIRQDY